MKNSYMKDVDRKLNELKGAVTLFNILSDKRMRVGLPSYQDQEVNLLPWETYDTLLMEEQSKIGNSNEKIVVLKGDTILNYLHT